MDPSLTTIAVCVCVKICVDQNPFRQEMLLDSDRCLCKGSPSSDDDCEFRQTTKRFNRNLHGTCNVDPLAATARHLDVYDEIIQACGHNYSDDGAEKQEEGHHVRLSFCRLF